MLQLMLMRAGLWALSGFFGGLGVFFLVYLGLTGNIALLAYVILFGGSAGAIAWSLGDGGRSSLAGPRKGFSDFRGST